MSHIILQLKQNYNLRINFEHYPPIVVNKLKLSGLLN